MFSLCTSIIIHLTQAYIIVPSYTIRAERSTPHSYINTDKRNSELCGQGVSGRSLNPPISNDNPTPNRHLPITVGALSTSPHHNNDSRGFHYIRVSIEQ